MKTSCQQVCREKLFSQNTWDGSRKGEGVHGVEGLKEKSKRREEKVHPGFIHPEGRFE